MFERPLPELPATANFRTDSQAKPIGGGFFFRFFFLKCSFLFYAFPILIVLILIYVRLCRLIPSLDLINIISTDCHSEQRVIIYFFVPSINFVFMHFSPASG